MGVFTFSTAIRGTEGNKLYIMKLQFNPIITLAVILFGTNVYGQSATATETIKKSSKIETYKIESLPAQLNKPEKAKEKQLENKKQSSLQRKALAIEPKKHMTVMKKDK